MRTTIARQPLAALLPFVLVTIGCIGRDRLDLPAGERAFAVTAGDVNGDGRADLVATTDLGEQADALSVWLGRGDRSFEPPSHTPLPISSRAEAVLLADLDRDGYADAVTANTTLFTVQVLLGDGGGGFHSRTIRPTPEEPQRLATGDLDGDGLLDCAVAHRDDGGTYLSVLFGAGDGDFSAIVPYSAEAGSVAFGVAIGDVNGDRWLDVVTAGLAGGPTLRVHTNRVGGALEPVAEINGGLYDVALADLDRTGHLDIVALERELVHVLRGSGSGRFTKSEELVIGGAANALLVVDLDGDGLPEIAVARDDDYVTVFWGAAPGAERRRQDVATGSRPASLAAADFDGDARLELVTANRGSPGSLTVLTL